MDRPPSWAAVPLLLLDVAVVAVLASGAVVLDVGWMAFLLLLLVVNLLALPALAGLRPLRRLKWALWGFQWQDDVDDPLFGSSWRMRLTRDGETLARKMAEEEYEDDFDYRKPMFGEGAIRLKRSRRMRWRLRRRLKPAIVKHRVCKACGAVGPKAASFCRRCGRTL